MPGINYAQLRSSISMADVLRLIEFEAVESSGDEIRGQCPIHGSTTPNSRSLAINVRKNTFRCFKCGAQGNHLDLWSAVHKLPLHAAARTLCESMGMAVPEVKRW